MASKSRTANVANGRSAGWSHAASGDGLQQVHERDTVRSRDVAFMRFVQIGTAASPDFTMLAPETVSCDAIPACQADPSLE